MPGRFRARGAWTHASLICANKKPPAETAPGGRVLPGCQENATRSRLGRLEEIVEGGLLVSPTTAFTQRDINIAFSAVVECQTVRGTPWTAIGHSALVPDNRSAVGSEHVLSCVNSHDAVRQNRTLCVGQPVHEGPSRLSYTPKVVSDSLRA